VSTCTQTDCGVAGIGQRKYKEEFHVGMSRRNFIKTTACAAVAAAGASAHSSAAESYQIGAYYFPNFHVDPRNELIHGRGWTEWEILKRGEPKFPGHHQPKKPLWGMEDESEPAVFEKKIHAAAEAGIGHFIFDWYWYEDAPFLNRAVEAGYLGAANKDRVKFCLMWANHDWYNLMPARLRELQPPLIYHGTYDATAFARVADYIISRYFSQPTYFTVDGAPYFSIYELKNLIERMGGLTTAQKAIEQFRGKVRAMGFPDLHLNAVAWGLQGLSNLTDVLPALGVRSVTSYSWAHYCKIPQFPASEYADMLEQAEDYWRKAPSLFGVPYHTDVSMGWDPSPRACQSDQYQQGSYPFTPILRGNTPQLFRAALEKAKTRVDSSREISKVLTINSWNEWTEGSHLEPESLYGMDYLDAIRTVFLKGA
jgi:hypothetical protein